MLLITIVLGTDALRSGTIPECETSVPFWVGRWPSLIAIVEQPIGGTDEPSGGTDESSGGTDIPFRFRSTQTMDIGQKNPT